MRKTLLSLMCMLAIGLPATAEDVTWTQVTDASTLNDGDVIALTAAPYSGKVSGDKINAPAVIATSYSSNLLKCSDFTSGEFTDAYEITLIKSGDDFKLKHDDSFLKAADKKIEEVASDPDQTFAITVSEGKIEIKCNNTIVSNKVHKLQYNPNLKNPFNIQDCRMAFYSSNQQPIIAYVKAGAVEQGVAKPSFSPAAGFVAAGTEVAISCSTEGASIYYTVNGDEPTAASTAHTAPVVVNEAMTIKAIAVLDDKTSDVATAEYKVIPANSAENPLTVDQTIQLINQGVEAEVYVKGVITEISEVSTEYGNATYKINDEEANQNPLTIFRGKYLNGDSFTAEDQIALGDKVIVYGKATLYNNTPELGLGNYIVSIVHNGEEPVEKCAEPTFSPAGGAVEEGTVVTISCATEGATIVYTVNDGDINEVPAPVTVTITEATEIVAYAAAEGYEDSEIVTVNYTIAEPVEPGTSITEEFDFTADGAYGMVAQTGNSQEYNDDPYLCTEGNITISLEGKTRLWKKTNGTFELRFQKESSLTIASTLSSAMITSVELVGATAANWEEGTVNANGPMMAEGTSGFDANTNIWTGEAKSVKLATTITKSSTAIKGVKVSYTTTSGVESFEATDGEAVYFNLQGIRISEPAGICIRVQNGKATKILK